MLTILFLIINISLEPTYFTNTNYVYDLTGTGTTLYCATNGGVVAYDYSTGVFSVLTSADGLHMNQQLCVGLDSSGCVWVGSDAGLAVIDPSLSTIQTYPDNLLPSTNIQDIFCVKDTLYIGTTGGLLIIDTKGSAQDFADDMLLTLHEVDGLPSENVLSICVHDTLLWVGTDIALARFKTDFSIAPDHYTTADGLLSNYINKVACVNDSFYVGTDLGLNKFEGTYFDTLLLNYEVNDISYAGDSLVLGLNATNQVGFYFQGILTIAKTGLPYLCRVLCLANLDGNLFCGLGNRYTKDYYGEGIANFDFESDAWTVTKNQSLPSNHITDITANNYGVFVSCGNRASESRGFGWLTNSSQWINFSTDSMLSSNQVHRCETSLDNKVWFGYNAFPNDTSSVMMFSFDPATDDWNFVHVGYSGMAGTVAVWDIKFDYHNNMYLSIAGPSDKLWVLDSTLETTYFLDPFQPGFFTEIAIDSAGRIWRTMATAGLIMTDTKNTLFNRDDDEYHNYTTSDGLISNYGWGCIVDRAGRLFVATTSGLAIYDNGFSSVPSFTNSELLDVELDSQGRVWILARDGIYLYDNNLGAVQGWKFTDLNVNIEFLTVSNEVIQVQGFDFDPIRSCFWMGGETGLLKLQPQFDTVPSFDNVLVYPNPAVDKNVIRIKNIPLDSEVDIYSIAGRKIAGNLQVDDVFGELVWQIPDNVGSGLYFALIKSAIGKKVCKFAIVR